MADPSPDARPTKERLADALSEIGQPVLAHRARQGEFDDCESPHVFPQTTLIRALQARATAQGRRCGRSACAQMIERVKSGEFDATTEEWEAWGQSPEGRQAFKDLTEGR